jgi:hypothetical protein
LLILWGGIVKIYPAYFFDERYLIMKYMIFIYSFFVLGICASISAAQPDHTTKPGFLEGHLKVFSSKEVDLADQTQSQASTQEYAEYPLIILSKDGKKEIARVTADAKGNYRVALPPGDYILDVKGRARGHLRAKPEPFTVVANKTVRVDMTIDTGVR